MAPSSVKGIDGMGISTTEAMNSGDELLSEYDGPSIPVLDARRSDLDSEAWQSSVNAGLNCLMGIGGVAECPITPITKLKWSWIYRSLLVLFRTIIVP
jgi:hypothetical protein